MLSARDLVARARAKITEISVAELSEQLRDAVSPVLIDVREVDEFEAGHIAGAAHIPRGVIELEVKPNPELAGKTHEALQDPNRALALYCRSGGRSALAAVALQEIGFVDVVSVAGGIVAWESAGLPVVRD